MLLTTMLTCIGRSLATRSAIHVPRSSYLPRVHTRMSSAFPPEANNAHDKATSISLEVGGFYAGESDGLGPDVRLPSDAQVAYARKLAQSKGIDVPARALHDAISCAEFIEDHLPRPSQGGVQEAPEEPSPKQLAFAQNIAVTLGVELPAAALASKSECSRFIDDHVVRMSSKDSAAPTAKQLAYAQQIAEAKGIALPADALSSMAACSTFIDENQGNLPPTAKQLAFATQLAQANGMPLPEECMRSGVECSAFITAQRSAQPTRPLPTFDSSAAAPVQPPTARQLAFAESLAEKTNAYMPPEVKTDARACASFIDLQTGAPSEKQLLLAARLARNARESIPWTAVATRDGCKAFIELMLGDAAAGSSPPHLDMPATTAVEASQGLGAGDDVVVTGDPPQDASMDNVWQTPGAFPCTRARALCRERSSHLLATVLSTQESVSSVCHEGHRAWKPPLSVPTVGRAPDVHGRAWVPRYSRRAGPLRYPLCWSTPCQEPGQGRNWQGQIAGRAHPNVVKSKMPTAFIHGSTGTVAWSPGSSPAANTIGSAAAFHWRWTRTNARCQCGRTKTVAAAPSARGLLARWADAHPPPPQNAPAAAHQEC